MKLTLATCGTFCIALFFFPTSAHSQVTPESEGVSSAGIVKFLDAAAAGRNELHSFVLVRHGKVVSEAWWNPYGKDLRHVMFSVSKSFTSMGVGIAISEGKLELKDRIVKFFPGSVPDSIGDFMKNMTVEDLLKMSTGMETDPIGKARGSSDWPKAFLTSTVEHQPGSVFKYNNMATFMLSAIVQKATGEKLFDYLKPRLLAPLGISNVTWDETPDGYTFGAIGLRIQSNDMARFGQMLLQKGQWNGKQIVPKEWVEQATSYKIASDDPSNKTPAEKNDWKQGYGYQFWRCRNNAYRADGLGGQFIIVLPEKDAVVVLTCSATNTQEVLDLVWDNLLPAIQDKKLPVNKADSELLAKRISSLTVKGPEGSARDLPQNISGKRIVVEKNDMGIEALKLSTTGDGLKLEVDRGNGTAFPISLGKDRWMPGETQLFSLVAPPRPSQPSPVKVAARFAWSSAGSLDIATKFIEESIGTENWSITFQEVDKQTKVHVDIKGMRPRSLDGRVVD